MILAVAAHWWSRTAIASHSRLALAAGIEPAAIDAILSSADPMLDDPERLLLACTRALLDGGGYPTRCSPKRRLRSAQPRWSISRA